MNICELIAVSTFQYIVDLPYLNKNMHYVKKLDNPRRNGQISRNIQPSKTKPGRNKKSEETYY